MPCDSLFAIYKPFMRPYLDYEDLIYDKPSKTTFSNRIESAQYNTALEIIGSIRGTSKEKLYQELGFGVMKERRWFRRICCFYKIFNNQTPGYLYSLLLHVSILKLDRFSAEQKLFLPQKIRQWNFISQSVKLLHIQYFTKHF